MKSEGEKIALTGLWAVGCGCFVLRICPKLQPRLAPNLRQSPSLALLNTEVMDTSHQAPFLFFKLRRCGVLGRMCVEAGVGRTCLLSIFLCGLPLPLTLVARQLASEPHSLRLGRTLSRLAFYTGSGVCTRVLRMLQALCPQTAPWPPLLSLSFSLFLPPRFTPPCLIFFKTALLIL